MTRFWAHDKTLPVCVQRVANECMVPYRPCDCRLRCQAAMNYMREQQLAKRLREAFTLDDIRDAH